VTIKKEFCIEYKIQLIHKKDKFVKFIENQEYIKELFRWIFFYISNLDSIINKVAIYDNKNQKNIKIEDIKLLIKMNQKLILV